MVAKILGVRHNEGQFEGKDYNNYTLFCAFPDSHTKGLMCQKYKVKPDLFTNFLALNKTDIDGIINKDIKIYYNQYGNVDMLELQRPIVKVI